MRFPSMRSTSRRPLLHSACFAALALAANAGLAAARARAITASLFIASPEESVGSMRMGRRRRAVRVPRGFALRGPGAARQRRPGRDRAGRARRRAGARGIRCGRRGRRRWRARRLLPASCVRARWVRLRVRGLHADAARASAARPHAGRPRLGTQTAVRPRGVSIAGRPAPKPGRVLTFTFAYKRCARRGRTGERARRGPRWGSASQFRVRPAGAGGGAGRGAVYAGLSCVAYVIVLRKWIGPGAYCVRPCSPCWV